MRGGWVAGCEVGGRWRGHVTAPLGYALGATAMAVLLLCGGLMAPMALASPAPPSCLAFCPAMASDLVSFKYNDPTGLEIVVHIDHCNSCLQISPTRFRITGQLKGEFGPYSSALCDPTADVASFSIAVPTNFANISPPPVGEMKMAPEDPNLAFPSDPLPLGGLQTRCVCLAGGCTSAVNLDYVIPIFALIGNLGARTSNATKAYLRLPNNVRSVDDAGILADRTTLSTFGFKQTLRFAATEIKAGGSPFRYWPDGLPFRLAPGSIAYTEQSVAMTTPIGYQSTPPAPSNIPGGAGGALIECTSGCTTPTIYNGGFFSTGSWTPGAASFDLNGLDDDLTLAAPGTVTYETTFPRGTKITLQGAATVSVRDSAITQGSFGGGTAVLTYNESAGGLPAGCARSLTRSLALIGSPAPSVKSHGAVVAGIVNLNAAIPNDLPWTYNKATNLGCGTLYLPPVVASKGPAGVVRGPQHVWLDSQVTPTARARGVYAGVNYNRDLACVGGSQANEICTTSADCPDGGACVANRFSPMCPSLATLPRWKPTLEGTPLDIEIVPGDVTQADREMAFVARASGITGVFDAGTTPRVLGPSAVPPGPPGSFDITLSELGLGFLDSKSELGDSITDGAVAFAWPSDTDIPFGDMSTCDCGSLGSAAVPESVSQRLLGYWDASFSPYALTFSSVDPTNCGDPDDVACGDGGVSATACISAITPVPHFSPDPDSVFGLNPDGTPEHVLIDGADVVIQPASEARLDFDKYLGTGYSHHLTGFNLKEWPGNGTASKARVTDPDDEGAPYGWVDAAGQVQLPLFGLGDAGILVRREKPGSLHRVDLHQLGFPDDPDPARSVIELSRDMADGTVPLTFKLDYFTPSTLANPFGTDAIGRGKVLGFATDLGLGSVSIGAGLVLEPNKILGDFGPAGAMRAWGNISHAGAVAQKTLDQLDRLMPGRMTAGMRSQYDRVLDALDGALDGVLPLADSIPSPDQVADKIHDAVDGFIPMDEFDLHPDFARTFSMSDPAIQATEITGYLDLSADPGSVLGDLGTEMPDLAFLDSAMDTGGNFFALARSQLSVSRYVKAGAEAIKQPIMELGRKLTPDSMKLPGKQDIAFPNIPGLQWDFDYDVAAGIPPSFQFRSLTGSLDLTKGGLSGLGFKELGATLFFDVEENWYFRADAEIDFRGNGVNGHILLGSTANLDPLIDLDPDVASFLGDIPRFNGAFLRVGLARRLIDFDCLLRLDAGIEVGGWYIASADSFGGKLAGFVHGRGICLLSVKGKLTMIGGKVGDIYKLTGDHWVAGGLGSCEEGDWDTPHDVLSDDWCWACVLEAGVTFTYPDNDLSFDGLHKRCK